MKFTVDDWHFRSCENDSLALDIFLSNGQHALLEVSPMRHFDRPNGDVPEMVAYCEFPGEKAADGNCGARWIARPPNRTCPWSNVEIPPALMQQIREKLGYSMVASVPQAA